MGWALLLLLLPAGCQLLATPVSGRQPAGFSAFAPIMGWNNCQIDCGQALPDDALVRETALVLNRSGLAEAGYRHLNLDDAWMGKRAANGRPQPNATRFPDWSATMEFVRSQGLWLGLYTAAGDKTCSGRPGSCQHEEIDAEQFVLWGISHVKDDACSVCRDAHKKGSAADYAAMASGLRLAAERHGLPEPILMVEGQPPLPLAADGNHGDVRRVGHDVRLSRRVLPLVECKGSLQ